MSEPAKAPGHLADKYYQNLKQLQMEEGGYIDTAFNDPRGSDLGIQVISFKENQVFSRIEAQADPQFKAETSESINYHIRRLLSHTFEVI